MEIPSLVRREMYPVFQQIVAGQLPEPRFHLPGQVGRGLPHFGLEAGHGGGNNPAQFGFNHLNSEFAALALLASPVALRKVREAG